MVRRVKINGKEMPLYLGFNALAEFTEAAGISIDDFYRLISDKSKGLTMVQARMLVYLALKEGARKVGDKFSLTPRDVGDMFDPIGKKLGQWSAVIKVIGELATDHANDEKKQDPPKKGEKEQK